jgi:hypothetical protein
MNPAAILFFLVFAGIVVAMYIAIRRRLGPTAVLATGGVLCSIIVMTLFSLAQDTLLAHALLVGLLLGGGLSVGALAIALYFQGAEQREQAQKPKQGPQTPDTSEA